MQFIARSDIPEPLVSAEETWAAQADLAKLLKRRGRRERDPIYSYNDKYGFGPCLHHFAGTQSHQGIAGIVPHGVTPYGTKKNQAIAPKQELIQSIPCIFASNQRCREAFLNAGKQFVFPIGLSSTYAHACIEAHSKTTPAQGNGSIFFRSHSTPAFSDSFDESEIIQWLLSLPKRYHPIRISIFPYDWGQGHYEAYRQAGFELVSAGHTYDPAFIWRHLHLIRRHRYTLSTGMGTHIFHSIMCKKPALIKSIHHTYKANRRDFAQYVAAKAEFQTLCDAFRFPHESPTREQIHLSQTWLGQGFTLTPKLLRNKIDEARSIHEKHGFTKIKRTGRRRRPNNDKTSQDASLRSSIPKTNKNRLVKSQGIQTENQNQHMMPKTNQPKISVIVPTRNRAHLLSRLIELFDQQTWTNKELLVLDDTQQGQQEIETLQAKNQHVRLWHISQTKSIGAKRNQLIEQAEGDLIAHFDDDDFYAPTYLEVMANNLLENNKNLVKLTGWFCFHQASKTLGYWDTTRQDISHTAFTGNESPKTHDKSFTPQGYRSFLTGYGFSYLYRKEAWEQIKFRDINLGEDSEFYEDVERQCGETMFIEDTTGICAHIIHKNNTSRCFPNHIIPKALKNKYFNGEVLLHEKVNKNAEEKKQSIKSSQQLQVFPATEGWGDNAPSVSICTLTYNRNYFLPLLQRCIEKQDYPHSKIEWLILNDSTHEFNDPNLETSTDITIKYQRLNKKLPLGKKRNLSHQLCCGDYIVYMDDDDYYYPSRIRHAVSSLIHSRKPIAGSTLMQIYYCHDRQLWLSGPFGQNHATANTFAMTKEFARSQHYKNEDVCNEERFFLNNYTIPMQQLNPTQTNICISHLRNTFDKRKMRRSGKNSKMHQLQNLDANTKSILSTYQSTYEKFQS